MLSRCLLGAVRSPAEHCTWSAFGKRFSGQVKQVSETYKLAWVQQRNVYSTLVRRTTNTKFSQFIPKQSVPHILGNLRRCATQSTGGAAKRAFPDITASQQKAVGRWLGCCAGMVFGAVALGGLTRLTESGLSITKWEPITGVLPPMGKAQWTAEFEKYKATPEYKYLEREMDLEKFKFIYFMEWFHRFWGRATGVVFLLPAAYFWKKGYLAKGMKGRILFYGALLASQAVMGIVMVNSGLQEKENIHEMPRVSQYRLASHLGLALFLYVNFVWSSLTHLLPPAQLPRTQQMAKLGKYAHIALSLTFLTALSGAFVAGLDAGLVYNSWPKFADRWIPTDILAHSPKWKNIFENHTTVQFIHRYLGEVTGVAVIGLWFLMRKAPLHPRARLAANVLLAMTGVQITLGIFTLLHFVPTHLAATHQSGAVMLLTFATWAAHELRRLPK